MNTTFWSSHTLRDLQILSIFLIIGMFTSSSGSLLGLRVEVERGLRLEEVTSLGRGRGGRNGGIEFSVSTLSYLLLSDITELFIRHDIVLKNYILMCFPSTWNDCFFSCSKSLSCKNLYFKAGSIITKWAITWETTTFITSTIRINQIVRTFSSYFFLTVNISYFL